MRRRTATEAEILNVERQIHEAALCPELWPEVMTEFSNLTHSSMSSVLFRGATGQISLAALDPRIPGDAWEAYRETWAERDDLAQAAERLLPDRIGTTDDLLPSNVARRSAVWNEFYLPRDFRYILATAPRVGSAKGVATLVSYRASSQHDFASAEVRIAHRLLPHFIVAIRAHETFRNVVSAQSTLEAAFDALQHAYFLVDASGKVLFQNRAARELVQLGDGFLLQGGRLRCVLPEMAGSLEVLIAGSARLLDGGCQQRGGSLQIARRSGRPPYLVTAVPISAQAGIREVPSPSVALRVVQPETTVSRAADLLRDLYGLTGAEARLALAICHGHSLKTEAEASGTTIGTLRTRLKGIFAKTGTSRQSELVSVLLRGPLSL